MLYSLKYFHRAEIAREGTDRQFFTEYLSYLQRHPSFAPEIQSFFDKFREKLDHFPLGNKLVTRAYDAAFGNEDDIFFAPLRDKNLTVFPVFFYLEIIRSVSSSSDSYQHLTCGLRFSEVLSSPPTLLNFVVQKTPRDKIKKTLFDYHSKVCLEISKNVSIGTNPRFYHEFDNLVKLELPLKALKFDDWRVKVRMAMIDTLVQRFKANISGEDPAYLVLTIKNYMKALDI